jgi:hypothetical protein
MLSHMISLSPDEVERRFGLLGIPHRFAPHEKRDLATTKLVVNAPDIVAFATPQENTGLNVLNLRRLLGTDPRRQPSFFDHPWYLEEPFAKEDCTPGWHIIHSAVLPDSISQPFHYASSLNQRELEIPSAVEVVLMLFLHFAGTGEQLLLKKHTWCRDQATMHRFVTVGAFGRNGLFVSGHPPDFTSRGLGICAKRRTTRSGGGDAACDLPGSE